MVLLDGKSGILLRVISSFKSVRLVERLRSQ